MIPGSNLLVTALTVIASADIIYYKFISRALDSAGLYTSLYNAPIIIKGSFQPIKKSMYAALGLNLSKKYANMYVPNDIIDVNRDVSGDKISFQGENFQCESAEPWFGIDGWTAVLCVKQPD